MTGLAILVVAMLAGVAFGLANELVEPRSVLARFGRKRLQRRERLRELERWYDDTYGEPETLSNSYPAFGLWQIHPATGRTLRQRKEHPMITSTEQQVRP